MSTKPLIPSLRQANRYIVFEIISTSNFNQKEIENTIDQTIKEYIGLFNIGKLNLKYLDLNHNQGIIKCERKGSQSIIAVLTLIKKINNKNVIIKTKYTSGILKKARSHLQKI